MRCGRRAAIVSASRGAAEVGAAEVRRPVFDRFYRRPTNTIERPVGEPDRHTAPLGDSEKRV